MRTNFEEQVNKLVAGFMKQIQDAVGEKLCLQDSAKGASQPSMKVASKVAQPSDARTHRPVQTKGPLKEGSRYLIIAALRKGEGCDELAKKYSVGVGSVRAIKANLTRGAYD